MNTKPPLETDTIDRLFLELSQVTKARTNRDMDFEFAVRQAGDIYALTYSIAERKGEDTDWEALKKLIGNAMEDQKDILQIHGEKK